LFRPRHGGDVAEVLRGAAQHRRPADVDHLDRLLLRDAVPGDDVREGIEVDADEIERTDLVLVQRREIVVEVAPREDRRVDARVERLDAAAEQLRDVGQRLDVLDLEPERLERTRGAAAGDELAARVGKAARELLEPGLVVDGDQRADSSLTTFGSSRCSTAWIRSGSVSRGSTGTGSCARTGPESRPSSTTWTVTPVVSTPAASASSIACAPGNAGK